VLGDVRGMGLLQGIELVRDQRSKEPFPVEAGVAFRFARACIDAVRWCTRAREARTGCWATTPW